MKSIFKALFSTVCIALTFSICAVAQEPIWIVGSSQQDEDGVFNSIDTDQMKFYQLDFSASLSCTQRVTGSSINNIMSLGTQDIMHSVPDGNGDVLFYVFSNTTVPFQSGGPSIPDTIYFASYDETTQADEVFGKVATEGWGSTVIESELVKMPYSTDEYYFIFKTKATSVNLDDIRYVTINSTNKTVSTATNIINDQKTGEGMAASQLVCEGNVAQGEVERRYLFMTQANANGNITLMRSTITSDGIAEAQEIYTISIPGNSIGVIAGVEISPTNDLLAVANFSASDVDKDVILFDYESETGALTNERYYTNAQEDPFVTMEFSPDGSRIFIMQGGSSQAENTIYSCPVSGDNYVVTLNDELDGLDDFDKSLTMEIAYNGKLYINPGQSSSFLYVVENPNSASPVVTATSDNFFGTDQRMGAGFPDSVDGESVLVNPCVQENISEESTNEIPSLFVFPNPGRNQLTIQFPNAQNKIGAMHINIYDVVGRCVTMEQLNTQGDRATFDISSLAQGSYTVECVQDKQTIGRGRFVVE